MSNDEQPEDVIIVNKYAQFKQKFLEFYRQLPIQKLAADFIGVNEDTITNWKNDDKVFSDQIASARSEWALNQSKRVRSREWLLERIMSDHFSNKPEATEAEYKPLIIIRSKSS